MQILLFSRRMVIALTLAMFSLAHAPIALAQQLSPDAIVGKWEADDGTVRLDMYKAGTEYQALFLYGNEVIEADGVTMKKDTNNPNPALRNRSLQNIVFVTGLHYENGDMPQTRVAPTSATWRCKEIS